MSSKIHARVNNRICILSQYLYYPFYLHNSVSRFVSVNLLKITTISEIKFIFFI